MGRPRLPGAAPLLVACLLASPLRAWAQAETGAVEGRITGETGAPIPGVMVTAREARSGERHRIVTNSTGAYRLALVSGLYEVRAAAMGFITEVRQGVAIVAGGVAVLDVTMKLLTIEELMSTPVISASRISEKANLAPSQVYVIREEDIVRNGYYDLKDALESVPGLVGIDLGYFLFGGQRGFLGSFSQTLLLLNGREMQNLIAGETFISRQFATHNVKQIEVIQGPGSVLYGANAFVGVINVLTKSEARDFEAVEAQADAGTQDTRAYSVVFGKSAGDWRVSGSLRTSTTDGADLAHWLGDGMRFSEGRADHEKAAIGPGQHIGNKASAAPLSLRLDWRSFYLGREAYTVVNRDAQESVLLDYENTHDDREFGLTYGGWSKSFGTSTEVSAEVQRYKERVSGVYFAFDPSVYATRYPDGGPIPREDVFRHFVGYYSQQKSSGSTRDKLLAQLTRRFKDGASLIVGLWHDRQDVLGIAQSNSDPTPDFDETVSNANPLHRPFYISRKTSAFAQYKRGLFSDRLLLTLGERLDRNSIYGSAWTFRSGLVWQHSQGGDLRLLFGQAFREPTIYELGGGTDGPFNASLKPARMNSFEVGLDQRFGPGVAAHVSVYHNRAGDLIVPLDTTHFANASTTRGVTGVEAQALVRWRRRFQGDVSYAYTDSGPEPYAGQIVENLGVYRHGASLGINYDLSRLARLNLRLKLYGSVDAKHGNPAIERVITIPSAAKVSVTVSSKEISVNGMNVSYQATVHNLFDTEVLQPNIRTGGPKQFLQPGRELLGRVSFRFHF